MRRRVRAIIEMLSLTTCAISVGFILLTHLIDPWESSKSIGKDLNVSLLAIGWDARLWLFNNNGPWGGPTTNASKVSKFACPGISYHRIVWANGEVNSSLDVSLIIPLLFLGVFPLLVMRRARKREQAFSILQRNATPDRCPECGTRATPREPAKVVAD
jgi:hypothetical protein